MPGLLLSRCGIDVWPLAGLAIALIVNMAWIGVLGYAVAKAALP